MKTTVMYYCPYCRDEKLMKIRGHAEMYHIYWLRCPNCKNNWKADEEEVEKLAASR